MAGNPRAYFFFPPTSSSLFAPSGTYRLGDSLNVSWTSDFPYEGTNIILFCEGTDNAILSLAGPLLAPQNAPPNNPYQFALTQDYGRPEALCHFYLTTVSPDDPTGAHNGYGNNSGTFNVVNDAGLQPVTWALTETTTSILSPSTSANTIESTSNTSTTTNRTTSLLSTSTSTTNTETMSMTAITSSTPLRGIGINAPSSRGPSSGIRAGAAAGVTCGVLSGAILSLLLYWKRRQKSNQGAEVTGYLCDSHQNLSHNGKELPGVEVAVELAVTPRRDELDGVPVAEIE